MIRPCLTFPATKLASIYLLTLLSSPHHNHPAPRPATDHGGITGANELHVTTSRISPSPEDGSTRHDADTPTGQPSDSRGKNCVHFAHFEDCPPEWMSDVSAACESSSQSASLVTGSPPSHSVEVLYLIRFLASGVVVLATRGSLRFKTSLCTSRVSPDSQYENVTTTGRFHIYPLVASQLTAQ
ncbi:hypothetical protein BP00DRAFT_72448 [Aspergillus indologenus CBS 114.80]|uniref:Uncharacterized protein n=1 Tax=Aspergillus indologenus CBS 114.80 TaxID=1450541 RepID=A0A2V5HNR7_9EURO|nr:hypothetical protein BP00DRAFT_72448 [Aspergillus indologenus CBS 114.80]